MEKRGLVRRVPSDQDKRANRLFITKKGKEMFLALVPVVKQTIEVMQDGIDDSDIQNVIRITRRIQENIKRTTTQTL